MAFTRIKQEKNGSDIDSARTKFNMALQNAMEKKHESPSSSDDESNKESAEIVVKKEQTPILCSSKKQPQRTQRKRRRKDDSVTRSSNTFVMKLFDRAVDLSPFTEETPLYPICRAWINNQPHQKLDSDANLQPKEETQPNSDIDSDLEKISEEQRTSDIYHLPPPRLINKDQQDGKDLRIPSPIPQPQEQFIICSDEPGAPSKEILMAKHMERWRAVRQKWKQAAQANEDRYRDSGAVLKDIYERSQCRDTTSNPEQWEAATTQVT